MTNHFFLLFDTYLITRISVTAIKTKKQNLRWKGIDFLEHVKSLPAKYKDNHNEGYEMVIYKDIGFRNYLFQLKKL